MAIVLVNKDGTSNAKAGDYVVTGGGVFYKNPVTGNSDRVMGLDTSTGSSKNFSDVVSKFNSLVSGNKGNDTVDLKTTVQPDYTVNSVDDNGLASVSVAGYDPADYQNYKTTSSSSGLSNVMGYVVLGLIGIALLDRFMNGGSKHGST